MARDTSLPPAALFGQTRKRHATFQSMTNDPPVDQAHDYVREYELRSRLGRDPDATRFAPGIGQLPAMTVRPADWSLRAPRGSVGIPHSYGFLSCMMAAPPPPTLSLYAAGAVIPRDTVWIPANIPLDVRHDFLNDPIETATTYVQRLAMLDIDRDNTLRAGCGITTMPLPTASTTEAPKTLVERFRDTEWRPRERAYSPATASEFSCFDLLRLNSDSDSPLIPAAGISFHAGRDLCHTLLWFLLLPFRVPRVSWTADEFNRLVSRTPLLAMSFWFVNAVFDSRPATGRTNFAEVWESQGAHSRVAFLFAVFEALDDLFAVFSGYLQCGGEFATVSTDPFGETTVCAVRTVYHNAAAVNNVFHVEDNAQVALTKWRDHVHQRFFRDEFATWITRLVVREKFINGKLPVGAAAPPRKLPAAGGPDKGKTPASTLCCAKVPLFKPKGVSTVHFHGLLRAWRSSNNDAQFPRLATEGLKTGLCFKFATKGAGCKSGAKCVFLHIDKPTALPATAFIPLHGIFSKAPFATSVELTEFGRSLFQP